MRNLLSALCVTIVMLSAVVTRAQTTPPTTSATDHKVRIHKVKRVDADGRVTERAGRSLRKQRSGSTASRREARVFRRHGHFADRDVRLRSKSKVARKEGLGVSAE
jgi:hypothetical protein